MWTGTTYPENGDACLIFRERWQWIRCGNNISNIIDTNVTVLVLWYYNYNQIKYHLYLLDKQYQESFRTEHKMETMFP